MPPRGSAREAIKRWHKEGGTLHSIEHSYKVSAATILRLQP